MRIGLPGGSFEKIILLSLLPLLSATADQKPANVMTVQGKVFLIDPNSSTIMVDTKGEGRKLVVYGVNTSFKYGRIGKAKQSSIGEIKGSDYITCSGALDDRERLIAVQCVYRESK